MSARVNPLWNVLLPVTDDIMPGETAAFDAEIERQLAHFEGMMPINMDDPFDLDEFDGAHDDSLIVDLDDDSAFDFNADTPSRRGRFS